MKKKSFYVHKEVGQNQYIFWANAHDYGMYMSANFQFKGLGFRVEDVFEKYCEKKGLNIQKRVKESKPNKYCFKDIDIDFELLKDTNKTKISFTRKSRAHEITQEDFLYFKNTVEFFANFIINYRAEGSNLIGDFRMRHYKGLVEIVLKDMTPPEEKLIDEMAFLLRNKEDPKKVRVALYYIRKYAKVIGHNPEEFLKKELGKRYFI